MKLKKKAAKRSEKKKRPRMVMALGLHIHTGPESEPFLPSDGCAVDFIKAYDATTLFVGLLVPIKGWKFGPIALPEGTTVLSGEIFGQPMTKWRIAAKEKTA